MAQDQDQLAALQEIRSLMERSARFTSLSGLSGIAVGLVALAGVALVYWKLNSLHLTYTDLYTGTFSQEMSTFLMLVAVGVLLLAAGAAIGFSQFKARKDKQSIWHHQALAMVNNLCIPMAAGGVFCLVLLYHHNLYLVAPSMLVFYGLALINSSKYTFTDIRYLGLGELVLGLLVCFQVEYGLVAWGLGFGGLHILYGALIYYKYERK
ncbi:hypothetical protein [Fibrella arboris]|uniref:hypothetical protein n=1 Tax=Fibrella arboris TaxID=3242486 RepID=UPI00352107E7